MEIIVRGWRSSSQDWARAQQWPLQDIPPLSEEQKTVARKLGITEEDYARSAYAGELSREALSNKVEQFGRLLEAKLREKLADSRVDAVILKTFDGKLQVSALAGGRKIGFEVDEDLMDRLMQSGSDELESRLNRIIDLSIPRSEAIRAS